MLDVIKSSPGPLFQMTEFGYARESSQITKMLKSVGELLTNRVHSVRIMGSGVLDLCWIACGRLDGCYAGVAGKTIAKFLI